MVVLSDVKLLKAAFGQSSDCMGRMDLKVINDVYDNTPKAHGKSKNF